MPEFESKQLPEQPDVVAPDGSNVRILLALKGGSCAHFELGAGRTSKAVYHKTVEEIWYVLRGRGEMWRQQGEHCEITPLQAGMCVSIPQGTSFQFRALSDEPLSAVAITMPPWPGDEEAVAVAGAWETTEV